MKTDYGTIDISLTSMSSRMSTIARTLQSMLDQDYGDLRIHLYLSRDPYLLDEGVPELPQDVAELQANSGGRLLVKYCPNWGPYRKLLPYLRENWGRSRLVVTADDDTIYPSDWLGRMVEAYDTYRCVIGYRGHRMLVRKGELAPYRSWMKSRIEENPSPLILPTGKDGILYNTAFFPIGVLNVEQAMKIAPTVDDLWFRWHLLLNNVAVNIINVDYRVGTFEETDYSSSLYLNYNKFGGNDTAIKALGEYFQSVYGRDVIAAGG